MDGGVSPQAALGGCYAVRVEAGSDFVRGLSRAGFEDGHLVIAVAYLRTSAEGAERALALVEQQNALQRFANEAGYKVVHWYVDADGVEVPEPALSRLMVDVVSEGREFNAVLVWNCSRLSRNPAELAKLAELTRKFREYGVELVSVADGSRLSGWDRQLAELAGAVDEEAAD